MPESNAADHKPTRKRPSRWHLPLWWANGFAVLLLLLTYLAPHVPPKILWPLALLAFAYPFQLVVHAFFLGYWLLFRRKRMLLSGCALLIGFGHFTDHVQFFGQSDPPSGVGESVKLLSWNVRLFDLYKWDDNDRTRDAIFDVLQREDAGILCLQEFFHSTDKRYFRTRDAIMRELGYRAEHMAWTHTARYDQHYGIATFSKRPIAARGRVPFGRRTNNICIWSDVVIGSDTIRVFNAHLASMHFGDADYGFIDSLAKDPSTELVKERGGRLLGLLRDGLVRRAQEAELIDSAMRASPHPVVFCGDINDVPMSYAYRVLRGDKRDAFAESGQGLGGTYIGKLPKLRIDHILHDEAIASWGFSRLPEELSDHHANAVMIAARPSP
ncbi:MAG TPA: endonuclease/exonuclease/phosphatase family protein [Flavobacteriales bacterium]|nr:endonuclease/exonuclease/phosphatase family protein [Flavobacteriales bacterium]